MPRGTKQKNLSSEDYEPPAGLASPNLVVWPVAKAIYRVHHERLRVGILRPGTLLFEGDLR